MGPIRWLVIRFNPSVHHLTQVCGFDMRGENQGQSGTGPLDMLMKKWQSFKAEKKNCNQRQLALHCIPLRASSSHQFGKKKDVPSAKRQASYYA